MELVDLLALAEKVQAKRTKACKDKKVCEERMDPHTQYYVGQIHMANTILGMIEDEISKQQQKLRSEIQTMEQLGFAYHRKYYSNPL